MPPTRPTVCAVDEPCSAWVVASSMVVPVDTSTAVPTAAAMAAIAVSSTAAPVAVSQPKNADPSFMHPNCSFCRSVASLRECGTPSLGVSWPGWWAWSLDWWRAVVADPSRWLSLYCLRARSFVTTPSCASDAGTASTCPGAGPDHVSPRV